ncbi:MAG: C4-type zinc ribbon domain-containing protein [Candidatus Omnitrophota bacterium]
MQSINFEEQLDLLKQLQSLDTQLYRLRRERGTKPKIIEELENKKNQDQVAIKSAEERFRDCQIRRKQRELDLQAKEDNVKKLQTQIYQLKSNKEYQTMKLEIEGFMTDNSLLEDQILALMEEADNLSKELSGAKETCAVSEKRFAEDKSRIDKEIAEIDKEISVIESQRKDLTAKADKKILSHYERVLVNREGFALVAVKDSACQGCFLIMPPQVINEIRMRDKIVTCESCARILYIEDETGL